jgi:hypothetical protein
MFVEFFVSLRIENNNNLNLETMMNMYNPKDSGRPPPEGPEPLMQGCNGLVDGLETSFQGCNGLVDGPEPSFQGCNGLVDGPEPSFQGCNGLVDGLETSFQGCNEKKIIV